MVLNILFALGLIFLDSSNESVFEEIFTMLIFRNEESKEKIFKSSFFVITKLKICL